MSVALVDTLTPLSPNCGATVAIRSAVLLTTTTTRPLAPRTKVRVEALRHTRFPLPHGQWLVSTRG